MIKIKYIALLFLILLVNQNQVSAQEIFPGLTEQQLIDSLRANYKPQNVLSYDRARDTMFAVIDNHTGMVRGVYSGYTISIDPQDDPSSDAYSKDMNTEHTWPQSKGADTGNANSDLHHLYPTRAHVNSSRSNDPFAEITDSETDTWWRDDYSQSNTPASLIDEYSEKDNSGFFEPREDHKGNAARSVFYFYTMYSEQSDDSFFENQKEILQQWHEEDPADAAEEARSEKIAGYQSGKENPFVLDPSLVNRAYFPELAGAIANPSQFTAQSTSDTQINLSWQQNGDDDDVMFVWNLTGNFDAPQEGHSYAQGQSVLGGTVIARQSSLNYTHLGLDSATTYYYRAFSVHGSPGNEQYSQGVGAYATTEGAAEITEGAVIITEIMQNPNSVYDSEGEWFEVYNTKAYDIDIDGWYIKDDDSDSHKITNGSPLVISANSYLVFGRNANTAENGVVEVDYQYSGIDLANGADEIVLLLADETTEIDRVEYDGGTTWPDPTGATMYLNTSYLSEGNNGGNWSVSTIPWEGSAGDFGSPGYSDGVSALVFEEDPENNSQVQVYPNPFNAVTVIKYDLTKSANTIIKVYDILGKDVRELENNWKPAGTHQLKWDSKDQYNYDLPSGIYFVRISALGSERIHKLTLIR